MHGPQCATISVTNASLSATADVIITASLQSIGEGGHDRPADGARGIEPAQGDEELVRLLPVVLPQMDERERLQRVEGKASGSFRQLI